MEYFIIANSFAAPFFSDTSEHWVEANSPKEALEKFADEYDHPCGLYAASCYQDANAKLKGVVPLAEWLSNHELAKQKNPPSDRYSYKNNGPDNFEIDGKRIIVDNPKGGSVVSI